jgi:hypothetical protein
MFNGSAFNVQGLKSEPQHIEGRFRQAQSF